MPEESRKPHSTAEVKHAIVASISTKKDPICGTNVTISFISGEGEVYSPDGLPIDPLFFGISVTPRTDEATHGIVDELTGWKNEDTPVDVSIKNGCVRLSETEGIRVIEIE